MKPAQRLVKRYYATSRCLCVKVIALVHTNQLNNTKQIILCILQNSYFSSVITIVRINKLKPRCDVCKCVLRNIALHIYMYYGNLIPVTYCTEHIPFQKVKS